MFLLSEAVAYWSSVVMLISSPAPIGISSLLTVLPVRISGPFCAVVSIAVRMSLERPAYGVKSNGDGAARLESLSLAGVVDNRLVVLVGTVGEVHADNVKAGWSTCCE